MKKNLIIYLIVLVTVLSGCSVIDQRKAVKKTYNAILAGNYIEAEKWAETAVIEGCNNKKFLKLKTNIEVYNDADEALNSLDYELAEKKMNDEEAFKGNRMNSALSDMTRKIRSINTIITLYEKNETSSYSVAVDYIDKLFADFTLTEQQKEKIIKYKESAQQKCIKRALETGENTIAINYADEFLADTTLSAEQTDILKNLKFDAQVADIEAKINDKFFDTAAKKKLQELLDSKDLTAAQRNRLLQISSTGTTSSTVQESTTTQLSPKAYITEKSAIESAKKAAPDAFKPNSNVTVTFNNGNYIINVSTSIKTGGEVVEDEVAFTVDALTGDVINIIG